MAGYRVDVSEPAENDLRDIVRYISSQLSAPITAMEMMDTIEDANQRSRTIEVERILYARRNWLRIL